MTPTQIVDCKFPGIYRFTNLINGKIYIGQSQNIYNRHKAHRSTRVETHFSRAIAKYGFSAFSFEVVERVDALHELNHREQYWIDHFQSAINGYNMCPVAGTCRGTKWTEARRLRASGNEPMRGRSHTDEAKAKISQAHKGRIHTDAARKNIAKANKSKWLDKPDHQIKMTQLSLKKIIKRVAQIDLSTGLLIREWDSVENVASTLGLNIDGLRRACRGLYYDYKRGYFKAVDNYKGYRWEYLTNHSEASIDKPLMLPAGRTKAISQICPISGVVVAEFNSAKAASVATGIPAGGIGDACRGRYWDALAKKFRSKDAHGGYRWAFAL